MSKLFYTGGQYPQPDSIERLAKYKRGRKIFDGKQAEVYERASEILKDTPHAAHLKKLYIAVNLMDVLLTKPSDLMVGEPPTYESGFPDDTVQQRSLNSIVEENDLNQLIHENVIGAGIRGDAWIKTYHAKRQDLSEIPEGFTAPTVIAEPIIESVDASIVFPELSNGSRKKFKAINIASIEWVDDDKEEIPYLNVERHVPGYIIYERYELSSKGVDTTYGIEISTYSIEDQVSTGRDVDIVETGVPHMLVHHVPYKTVDDDWKGISGIEKLESVLVAINDRLVQIDYILWGIYSKWIANYNTKVFTWYSTYSCK
ncbi:phage portal protein [Chengkuizengella axinellae]|uniref:Phage portal protein n=1 Tax=Chengkuizengella axinellae TaxID=3064388 RepID=A0ABT9IV51_9BACL|nr:phage portal protein [Chengkuizengella sp. 2205SS18-9]MDP5273226.1 phage portal protein [Chengkuizengella sp. 2205SS18-9]